MRFHWNGTRDVVLQSSPQMVNALRGGNGNKRTSEQRLSWFQHLRWLARLLENNLFRKRTLYCWRGRRRVYRNGHFLDRQDKRIDWKLTGKHLEYGQIWLFFKALPNKGLVEKGKQAKGGKKSTQRLTVTFFVCAAGVKIDQPIVIWKSKPPCCFKKLQDL